MTRSAASPGPGPRSAKRANPASWITSESIAHARAGLPELAFRRFVANQWTERAQHWLPHSAWQQCVSSAAIEDGEPVYVGVDVGGHALGDRGGVGDGRSALRRLDRPTTGR